jgi:hypothetical protein
VLENISFSNGVHRDPVWDDYAPMTLLLYALDRLLVNYTAMTVSATMRLLALLAILALPDHPRWCTPRKMMLALIFPTGSTYAGTLIKAVCLTVVSWKYGTQKWLLPYLKALVENVASDTAYLLYCYDSHHQQLSEE